jgi:hypothetical protein
MSNLMVVDIGVADSHKYSVKSNPELADDAQ